ncbi:hypothetical protein [Corallococcus terminator]|uniref:Uncharacterized protein n=1 Tax=Corallococcus terminator TaxID=2316733 RepID=A0A3A8JH09_9BACT|nr:hypothetical protein [Corallococcus terminator]RKG88723.1 hypothetical protein D7V88_13755 [Corallococcus terminator]
MSKKDVLHIPLEGLPPVPERQAGTEDEAREHRVPPTVDPDSGPGESHDPLIINPVISPRSPYPGVSVT